ncbi:MAG TPA: tetratricopeptide repeat protein [Terriglobia bacterium]|nr:tetratricopeptide repeat protein [Terriglobia bacterium]
MHIVKSFLAITLFLTLAAATAFAQRSASEELRLGAEAANTGNFSQAAGHFQSAARLQPNSLLARLHLASAYAREYMAGPPASRSEALAEQAIKAYDSALRLDPSNKLALWDLAVFSLAAGHPQASKQSCEKLIQVDGTNANAWYLLGMLDWELSFKPYLETLREAGLKPGQPGFIRNTSLREKYRAAQSPLITAGLQAARKARQLDPNLSAAMIFENMLLRESAAFAENEESYRRTIAEADMLAAKAGTTRQPLAGASTQPELQPNAPPPPLAAPPPPPPPPRPTSG